MALVEAMEMRLAAYDKVAAQTAHEVLQMEAADACLDLADQKELNHVEKKSDH